MTQKLKLLIVSDPLFTPSGYGNTNLDQMMFLKQHFDLGYICWGWRGLNPDPNELSQAYPGINFYPVLNQHHGKDVFHYVVNKFNPDVILLHGDIYMFYDNLKEEVEAYRGKKCILAMYPLDGEFIPLKWIPFIQKLDGLITLTEFAKKETLKYVKAPVDVVPLGVDSKLFFPLSGEAKNHLRETKFPFMKNRFVVTWVGRNFSRKNPGLALAGFHEFVKKNKAENAMLYMHCNNEDPAGFPIMEIVSRDFPLLMNKVCFPENPHMHRKTLAEIMQCSDVGLNTSLGEGWGMPITESMACGVPVIAPAHSACKEQLGDQSERGELIDIAATMYCSNNIQQSIGDSRSLANKLSELYKNSQRWVKKAKAGHEWASQMTWEKSSNKLTESILKYHQHFLNEIPRSSYEVM